ncbi:MAG: nicotinate (nicotinamide) nucleotide adenylyltransferase [Bacteroidales bacterium]|jgi:nicotinate-nucleotide adenylyltransferase|nr:nicotinate (nicotinamide) nucleotide adenylyltransferase [Bacteroidales bacterium]
MVKIGLYFGSFNPIHLGHLAIAGFMTEFSSLDQVWFVVSPHNPLKKKESLLADRQRLYMTRLAIGENERLKASDIEFTLPVPSFTIDTLAYLKDKYPQNEYCLVMGEDNLYTLHKWKNTEELIKNHMIYVYPRPYTPRPESPLLDQILSNAHIHWVKAPLMDISGAFIRNGIKKGKNMSYFLAPPVWKYIGEMHFYEK